MVRADLESALREAGRGLAAGHHRLRSALVVLQVAVALLLLVGAGLLMRSFQLLLASSPGFDARERGRPSPRRCPDRPHARAAHRASTGAIRDRLMAVPGVRSAAAVSRLPLMGSNLGSWMFVEGQPLSGAAGLDVEYRVATSDYFATMGIPLRAGRLFDEHDDANAGAVLLVNRDRGAQVLAGRGRRRQARQTRRHPEQRPGSR